MNGDVRGLSKLPYLALGRKRVIRRSSFEAWKTANEQNHVIVGGESEVNAVDAFAEEEQSNA